MIMTKLHMALVALTLAAVAVPVALRAQTEPAAAPTAPAAVSPIDFTVAADEKSGGVWRLNARTGELWFCLASAQPKCYSAENVKK
jgi:hypothetical protein